ncbi:DUF6858 family protein [Thiococcus pfennigii]|jgi:hypothetical protein|uniref:DUF6858 family protein n=1 Tax=Thiococcus pfennigii TaxID=1057 RepID=UPI00190833D7|nr:hypothetical protein [Thiococcus pfennigii]MBK1700881.1 hypothetical protein [Thiococcus pfennigii]MBK1732671.1 hypothetical protein [Thiococcus pfennigii]
MKQSLRLEGIPVYALEIDRDETPYQSVDEIVAYFRTRIEAHAYACVVAEFDHLAHTRSLPTGQIGDGIRAAKNLVFCFGLTLPDPLALAMRPRSIGIAETDRGFVVTFLEAPMPVVNAAMEDWAKGLLGDAR